MYFGIMKGEFGMSSNEVEQHIRNQIRALLKNILSEQANFQLVSEKISELIQLLENSASEYGISWCVTQIKAVFLEFTDEAQQTVVNIFEQFQDKSSVLKDIIFELKGEESAESKKREHAKKTVAKRKKKSSTLETGAEALPKPFAPAPAVVSEDLEPTAHISESKELESIAEMTEEEEELLAELEEQQRVALKEEKSEPPPRYDDVSTVHGQRNVLIDYFSQMNTYRVYPLTITISEAELERRKYREDILTGEKREQVEKEISVREQLPLTVGVYFPGCLVTPTEQRIELLGKTQQLTFFVTPIAKGKMKGSVVFYQEGKKISEFTLDFKIFDQRLAKAIALTAMAVSAVPSSLYYLFGIDINQQITTNLVRFIPLLTSPLLLALEIVLSIMLLGASFYLYKQYSAVRKQLTATYSS